MPANLENSAVATGLEKVSFHSNPKERNAKECSNDAVSGRAPALIMALVALPATALNPISVLSGTKVSFVAHEVNKPNATPNANIFLIPLCISSVIKGQYNGVPLPTLTHLAGNHRHHCLQEDREQ